MYCWALSISILQIKCLFDCLKGWFCLKWARSYNPFFRANGHTQISSKEVAFIASSRQHQTIFLIPLWFTVECTLTIFCSKAFMVVYHHCTPDQSLHKNSWFFGKFKNRHLAQFKNQRGIVGGHFRLCLGHFMPQTKCLLDGLRAYREHLWGRTVWEQVLLSPFEQFIVSR